MSQENHFTVALRCTCILPEQTYLLSLSMMGYFLSRCQCAVQIIALPLSGYCRMSRIGSADVVELNDGCCVNKKMVEAKMLHRTSRRCLRLALVNNLTCRSSPGSPALNVNVELVTARPAHQYLQFMLVLRSARSLVTCIHPFFLMISVLHRLDVPPSRTLPDSNSIYFLSNEPGHRAFVIPRNDRISYTTARNSIIHVSR